MKPKGYSRLRSSSVALIVATFTTSFTLATTDTWTGTTSGAWALSGNWATAPAIVPGAGETATFNAASANTTIDLGAGVSIGSVVFDTANAAAYTLGSGAVGSQALTLSNAGALTLNAAVANPQLINANVILSTVANSTTTISNSSASLLTLAGAVNAVPPTGNSLLTVGGAGNTTITGAITETGAGSSALLKTGAGTVTLAGGGTYTGSGALGRIPATAAGYPLVAREGTLLLNGGTHTVTGELVIGGVVADGGAGQNAKIQVDAGSLAISSWLSVGRGNGVGAVSSDLVVNNAATVTSGNFSAGFNGGNAANLPKGSVTLNNTSSLSVNNDVNIAESAGSNITLNVNGTSSFSQTANAAQTRVGGANGAAGFININGGTASFHRDFVLGYSGTGTGKLVINSGTFNAATTVERWLIINQNNTSSGQIDVNGGNLNLNTNTDLRFSTSATSAGTSVVNLNSGAITGYVGNATGGFSATSIVDLQNNGTAAANNTFNLNGGTLTIGQVITSNNSGISAFNFNGGTLKATGDSANFVDLGGANQKTNVQSGGAIIDSNSFNVTIVDALLAGSPSGGLTKNGAGKLSLSASSTYTGATQVTGGTLSLINSGAINSSSAITVNGSGAKLLQANTGTISPPVTLTNGSLDGSGTITTVSVANLLTNTLSAGNGANGVLTTGTLTFSGAATINARANGTVSDEYIITTDLATSASAPIVVNATNVSGVWTSGIDYPIIQFTNYPSVVDASHFSLGTVPGLNPNQTASLVNTGSSISLRITGESLVWTGSQSADWTTAAIGGTKNWSYLGSGIEFSTNSPVVFDDTATLFNVNLAQNVSPSAVVFNNSNDYSISSTGGFGITSGSIVLNGFGRVTINNVNTYTGTTIINAGTLEIAGTGSIATSSSITNNSNLVFNLTGSPNTYANPITGTGAVLKQGAGALTLSGASTFTGDFTLDAGTLNFNSPAALGTGPGTIIINGGILDNTSGAAVTSTSTKPQTWNTDISFTGSNSLAMGTGTVTLGGAGTSRTANVPVNTLGVGGVNSFGYDLVKTGAGTLALNGVSNIGGVLDIQTGIVATKEDLFASAPSGTGILQNSGAAGTKWTFWIGDTDSSSPTLIRNNDGTNTRQLGIVKRGTATLTLTNNANFATSNLSVDNGKLILNNTGTYGSQNDDGSTVTNLTALVGNTALSNGVLEINGATVNYNNRSNAGVEPFRGTLSVGFNATGAGVLNLNSGNLTLNKQLALGAVGGAFGAMNQTGGTTTIGGFLAIGLGASNGVFNLSGGTYTMNGGPVTNGAGAGSVGLINLSGNAVYNHTAATNNAIWLGENGTGVMNVSGTAALTAATNGIELGKNSVATASGTLNLLGGTVTANYVSKPGALATGVLNFNGGTLASNVASATFLTGLTNAFVHSGGGTISNGGNAITIGQALLAPGGNGVSASGLTVSGGGYIATPQVTITGDGTGATAVANIDAGGNLTGITITNPGTGYTTAPTFALVGGGIGNTGSLGGAATIAANVSGSMAFTGAGTTTLSAVNTYTGNTTVSTGTTLALADNAGLKFVIAANGVNNKVTGTGTATLDGDFTIDLTGAAIANGNSWTLVDTTTKSFTANFTVAGGFTEAANVWTKVDGDNTWTFSESTGVLSLTVASAGYNGWKGANAGGQTADLDFDLDGVKNGVEYFMNAAAGFTANPSVVVSGATRTVTWTNGGNIPASAYGSQFVVQTSTDLVTWSNVPIGSLTTNTDGPGGSLTYTLSGSGTSFVRLVVSPN